MATITGDAKDDVLATGAGADIVTGLNGNDVILIPTVGDHVAGEVINGGLGFDRLWINSGGGTLVLLSGVTAIEAVQMLDAAGTLSGASALNLNASAVTTGLLITGSDADDTITGTGKDDVLVGGLGEDSLIGGAGKDRVIMEVASGQTDDADAGAQTEGNTLILVGAAPEVAYIDLLAADQLVKFDVTLDNPVQKGFSNIDVSGMSGFGAQITASAGKNVLIGTGKDDVFFYSDSLHYTGDAISGGAGKADALRFSSATAGQMLTLNAALVGVERAEIADAAGDESGLVTLSLSAALVTRKMALSGNDGANTITGTAFDDTLQGNGGADSLAGGKGNDLYLYDDASDGVVGDKINELSTGGKADYIAFTGTAGSTLTLGSTINYIEGVFAVGLDSTGAKFDLEETTDRHIDGSAVLVSAMQPGLSYNGNAGANSLTGGKGADTFTGGKGVDTIMGGAGNDVVIMDLDPASVDVIDAGDAIVGTVAEGNTLRLRGNLDGAPVVIDLSVAAGADQVLFIDGAGDAAVQSDFAHVDATEVTGKHGVTVTASAVNNFLIGSPQDDIFVIASAADFKSTDKIQGGGGKDTVYFTSTTPGQIFVPGANIVTLEEIRLDSNVDTDAYGEVDGNVTLSINAATATTAFILTGNDGLNTLTGSTQEDTLNGNGGIDVLVGGKGDDEYLYDAAADFVVGERITELAGGGTSDTVRFASKTDGENLVLGNLVTGIERIVLDEPVADTIAGAHLHASAAALGNAVTMIGNDGNNTLIGTKFADRIEGGKGVDTLIGGLGNDTLVVSADLGEQDSANGGKYAEGNLLMLVGDDDGSKDFRHDFDLSVTGPGLDQSLSLAGVQEGFARIDASGLNAYVDVTGSSGADFIIGSNHQPIAPGINGDSFRPGLGADTVRGGVGDDDIIITTAADLVGDLYSDSGGSAGDYLIWESTKDNQSLVIPDSVVNGIDVAAASTSGVFDDLNLNISVALVNKPMGLAGNSGRNVLTGNKFGSTIFDWGGADTMIGGLGSDDYVIGADWVHAGAFVDKIMETGTDRDDMYNATFGQLIVVNPANINGIERFVVSGADLSKGGTDYVRDIEATNNAGFDLSAWNNTKGTHLAGSFGDNLLIATKYSDTIIGHKGQDTIVGGLGSDTITMEVAAADLDAINAGLNAENNQLILKGDADDVLHFNLGGAEGADQLVMIGAALDDILVQSGFRHVNASAVAKFGVDIIGSAAPNTLIGTGKDDTLEGGDGVDKLFGAAGNDVVVLSDITHLDAGDLADLGEGIDALRFASLTDKQSLSVLGAQFVGLEAVMISDAAGDISGLANLHLVASAYGAKLELTGNGGANSITGTSFADTIRGADGADTLRGGAGNDVYVAITPGEVVTGVASDAIQDTSGGADVFRFSSEIDGEVVVLTDQMTGIEIAELANDKGEAIGTKNTGIDASAFATKLTIRGNDGDNTLTGGAFNDAILGNKGHDTILGGLGADTITMLMVAADRDEVDGGDIADLGGNMLVLLGDAGGASVWDLTNTGDQLTSVGGGAPGVVIADMTHIDASGLTGAVSITGSAEANTLIGTSDNDAFVVLAAAHFALGERIDGKDGTTDTIEFASTADGEILVLSALVTGVEEVEATDASADVGIDAALVGNGLKITGNGGDNTLTGTAKGDTIAGGAGIDSIIGGAGADKITVEMDSIDAVDAGAGNEGDNLVLTGAAAAAVTVNLSLASPGDQLSVAGDALVQSGFQHVDASAVTGFGVTVTGSAGNNSITGTAGSDVINAFGGADTISMNVASGSDAIDAGALAEGNLLVLTGAAGATVLVDLSVATDQVTGPAEADNQIGFAHLDASGMSGGLDVTGSAGNNNIIGSSSADTINGGAGADRITWNAGQAPDELDGGGAADGDTLVLIGSAAAAIVIDLAVAPGEDIIVADAAVQANFQHLDASALGGNAINARGNGLNNVFHGSNQGDTLTGLAGSDTFWLGGGDGVDSATDLVRYESPRDGITAAGVVFSFDRIREFKAGQDDVVLTGAFNGGPNDIDDVTDNNILQLATNLRADFSLDHEALLITHATSKLTSENALVGANFSLVVAAINRVGVTAATGDDGLIVVQARTSAGVQSTGVYYYQELDGVLNKASAGELTLLGVFDAHLGGGDLALL